MFFRQFLAKKNQNNIPTKITQSNVQLHEYAALCQDVCFKEQDSLRPALPSGWHRILDSGQITTGYFGAVYANDAEKPTEIVFVHRAAVPNPAKNMISNIKLGFKNIPNWYLSAEIFLGKALDYLLRNYSEEELKSVNFSASGHAFGGALAEICSAYFIPVISFENPGSKESLMNIYRYELQNMGHKQEEIEKLLKTGLQLLRKNCFNYCNDINAMNSAHEQVGNSFLLQPLQYDYAYNNKQPIALEKISLQAALNAYYLYSYSMQQNALQSICDKLKEPIDLQYVRPIIGFQNAYQAYLDYDSRKTYWDGYINYFWQQHDEVRKAYQDDVGKFSDDFIQNLKLLRQEIAVPREAPLMDEEDKLSLSLGGFAFFAHPDNKPTKLNDNKPQLAIADKPQNLEEDFQMVNKDKDVEAKIKKHERSNCLVM